jgi:cytidylate kinase
MKSYNIVERQFKSYSLKESLLRDKGDNFKPSIVVSRENGSGGAAIAYHVARTLGFKLYDKELIEMIATRAKIKEELIESLDEKTQDSVNSVISGLLGIHVLPEHTYIKSLVRVVLSIAYKGRAVILGRGANFFIPPQQTLRVRVIAPMRIRVANALKFEYPGLSSIEVRDKLLKVHLERKNFTRKYFNKDISNANYYDLVINTEFLTIRQASGIIIAAFRNKFGV